MYKALREEIRLWHIIWNVSSVSHTGRVPVSARTQFPFAVIFFYLADDDDKISPMLLIIFVITG